MKRIAIDAARTNSPLDHVASALQVHPFVSLNG